MLIGYEGGIVAYDFRQAMPVKTFEMTLPPGAPGGGTYDDANVSRLIWIT
jgi:syntaxin-binding protein 5